MLYTAPSNTTNAGPPSVAFSTCSRVNSCGACCCAATTLAAPSRVGGTTRRLAAAHRGSTPCAGAMADASEQPAHTESDRASLWWQFASAGAGVTTAARRSLNRNGHATPQTGREISQCVGVICTPGVTPSWRSLRDVRDLRHADVENGGHDRQMASVARMQASAIDVPSWLSVALINCVCKPCTASRLHAHERHGIGGSRERKCMHARRRVLLTRTTWMQTRRHQCNSGSGASGCPVPAPRAPIPW